MTKGSKKQDKIRFCSDYPNCKHVKEARQQERDSAKVVFNEMQDKLIQQGAEKMLYTIEHFFVTQTKNKFDYKEIHEFLEQLKKEAQKKKKAIKPCQHRQ